MYKNVNTISNGFSAQASDATAQHAVVIDDVIIIGRRPLRKHITREVLM